MTMSLSRFQSQYDTVTFPVRIVEHVLQFLQPASIDQFIDTDDPMADFPLWAKFWEASIVLTQYMTALPVQADRRILELGSGLGLVGIAATILGHNVTLTERNQHALNFIQANADLNGCRGVPIRRLDWFDPTLEGRFDLIIGSEIVYQECVIDPLLMLFDKHLAPGGRVVLAECVRTPKTQFFERASSAFQIRTKKHTLHSKEKSETVVLFELKAK